MCVCVCTVYNVENRYEPFGCWVPPVSGQVVNGCFVYHPSILGYSKHHPGAKLRSLKAWNCLSTALPDARLANI